MCFLKSAVEAFFELNEPLSTVKSMIFRKYAFKSYLYLDMKQDS
jgi:hypothetical protein